MVTIWIFSETGFISIVEYMPRSRWDKEAKRMVTTDKFAHQLKDYQAGTLGAQGTLSTHLLARARVEADLDPLIKADPDAVHWEDKGADYQFRIIVKREAVADFLRSQVMRIDYDSHVKETINRRAPQIQGGRLGGLMAVWSAIAKWQPNPPYGWSATTSFGKTTGTGALDKGKKPWSNWGPWNKDKGSAKTLDSLLGEDEATASFSEQEASEFFKKYDDWEDDRKDLLEPEGDDVATTVGGEFPVFDASFEVSADVDRKIEIDGNPSGPEDAMLAQIKETLKFMGATCDPEAVMDEMVDLYGFTDISILPFAEFQDVVDMITNISEGKVK